MSFASAEADTRRESALEGRFQSARKPTVGGRPARRMNSASRGLRLTVGLRRPEKRSLRRRRPTPGAQAPWKADFNRRGGLRPMVGLCRPGGCLLRRRRPTSGAQAPWKADFNRREGLRPAVGLHRPEKRSLRRRRPTLGAERPGRPISIGRSRDPARSRRRGLGLEGSSFPMTAVAIGTLIRGESPSYKKQSFCRSGFRCDHGGIEEKGFGLQERLSMRPLVGSKKAGVAGGRPFPQE